MFTPLCNSLFLNIGKTCDLLLVNNIWQRWWNVPPIIMLGCKKTLSKLTLFLSFWLWRSKQIFLWRRPSGKELLVALVDEGSLCLTANKKLRPRVLQLWGKVFCQWHEWAWKQMLPQLNFQMKTRSSRHLDSSQADPELRTQLSQTWNTELQSLWGNECVSF